MAPITSKRQRLSTYDDDEEEHGVGSPSSSPHHDTRKRPRLSTAFEDRETTELTLSDGVDDEYADVTRHGYNDGGYQADTQMSYQHEAELEDLLSMSEQRQRQLTRLIQKRFNQRIDNHPAENAIVEEIKCVNFMCHSHLTVSLGPLINFIIGHNGSGKSAVLTALTLCLGAKATSTNRGQNLKSFIKAGEESAMLAVKIKNQGSSAYKPELYGRSIIVERHFSTTGASGFRLRNSKDKVISTKKADLEDIIDAFQLQIDNPMNVLSQDMARQFLNHSTPSDKFRFFLEGTNLHQLDIDYRLLEHHIDETEDKLRTRQNDRKDLEAKYKEAKRKQDLANKQEVLLEKRRQYVRQMAWIQVQEMEQVLEEIEHKIAEADEKIEERRREAEAKSEAYDNANRQYEESQQLVEETRAGGDPIKEELQEKRAVFDRRKKDLLNVIAQQRDLKSALKADRKTIESIKNDIENEKQRQEGASGGEHARRLQEIQEAKARIQEAKAAFQAHSRNFGSLERQKDEAEAAMKQARPLVAIAREDVEKQQRLIGDIRRNQGRWMSAYDQNLNALLRAIDNEQRFRQRPIGPFGRHIRLLKPEWGPILEKFFGGTLNAFVVTSKQDEGLLRELMRRTRYPQNRSIQTPIFIGHPEPINTSAHEPDANLLTCLRALTIDNDLVRNQLIINHSIEQVVLMNTFNEAQAFAHSEGQDRPRNVKQVYCFGRSKRDGTRLGWTGAGGATTSPVAGWDRTPRMQADMESQISVATASLQQARNDASEAERTLHQRQTDFTQASQALERHKREDKNLQLNVQQAENQVEELQDALEAETPQAGKLESLESQLKEQEDAREARASQFQDAQVERDRLDEAQRDLKAEITALEEELRDTDGKVAKVQARVQKVADKRERALLEKNHAFESVEDAKEIRTSYETDRENQQRTVAQYHEEASKISARVEVPAGESAQSLDKKIEKLDKEVTRYAQQVGGQREDLNMAAEQAKANLIRAQRQVRDMEYLIQTLKRALMDRTGRLKKFRICIGDRAKIAFTYLLAARKFRGQMKIDEKSKQLDLTVEPDLTRESDRGRQTKTLSGGEKSFSTVCLLLSLWDAMGSPTRCLDEFDVFMDSVNRDISMNMIINSCRRSPSKQFLFITPQAMGNVTLGEDVKIIKMSDPERGQTALPF